MCVLRVINFPMSSVVFVRGINVGGRELCKRLRLAQSAKDVRYRHTATVRHIRGAQKDRLNQSARAIANSSFKCELRVFPPKKIVDLPRRIVARQPSGPDIRGCQHLHKQPHKKFLSSYSSFGRRMCSGSSRPEQPFVVPKERD